VSKKGRQVGRSLKKGGRQMLASQKTSQKKEKRSAIFVAVNMARFEISKYATACEAISLSLAANS
jgi:hypothetical protein